MKQLRIVAVLGMAAVLNTSSVAFAQFTGHSPANTETDRRQNVLIEIKNVPSNVMAYWLDPAHNTRPTELGASDKTENKGPFELPTTIERIVAVGSQNQIQVTGVHDEDFRQLVELIDVLDQPLRQIEIEAQIVDMSREDAKTFGIDPWLAFKENSGQTEPVVGFVRNNYMARLNALVADNRAKIVGAPRAIVANNFRERLALQSNRTVPLTAAEGRDPNKSISFSMHDMWMEVVPTINGDNSISLQIDVYSEPQSAEKTPDKVAVTTIVPARGGNNGRFNAQRNGYPITHVSSGDTIVLGGLSLKHKVVPRLEDIPLISELFRSKQAQPETLIFITPRMIRRVGDDETKIELPQK